MTPEDLAARGLRVRELVFDATPVFGTWWANDYRIERLGYSFRLYRQGSAFGLKSFRSLKRAIAFANDHNCARIIAALEETPK